MIVNTRCAPEVGFFVHGIAIEVENPGFDVAFWNQVDNSFSDGARGQSFGREAFFKLSSTPSGIFCIRVDGHNERGLSSCRPCAIRFDVEGVARADPCFSASLSADQGLEPDVARSIVELL